MVGPGSDLRNVYENNGDDDSRPLPRHAAHLSATFSAAPSVQPAVPFPRRCHTMTIPGVFNIMLMRACCRPLCRPCRPPCRFHAAAMHCVSK